MKVVRALADLRRLRADLPNPHGLVPTMGALHEGHLSLVRRAKRECDSVGVSIFVNPAQFGPAEDLASYPRNIELDLSMLEAQGVDVVWTPEESEVYPPGFQTWVTVEELSRPLEGARRPGHFRGVATVVAKLFNAFQPQRAFFGQKDAQQVMVIRRMAADLDFPVEIAVCPTVRESDGLAMSSRNAYLKPAERQAATVLFRALTAAKRAFDGGERDAERLREILRGVIAAEPLAKIGYVSVADPSSLAEAAGRVNVGLMSLAVQIGNTMLIDNLSLDER
jgi:pantoate--beta-alanine ligase